MVRSSSKLAVVAKWVWLKFKQEGLRRFWPLFPLIYQGNPCWCRFFEPQPNNLICFSFGEEDL